jgi:predicted phosphodiesterase
VGALYDVHIEYGLPLPEAYRVAKLFVKDMQPDLLVIGGDFADLSCISHWTDNKPGLVEGKRYSDDCKLCSDELAELKEYCGDLVFLIGNHEDWVEQLCEKRPALRGQFDIVTDLGLDKTATMVVPVNEVFQCGDHLNFIHGWKICMYHARHTLNKMGGNVFYGHTHDHQTFVEHKKACRTPHIAMSLGCLCHPDPKFMRNRPNDWVHGFGWFEVRADGFFNPYFISICNSACSYAGQEWRLEGVN